MLLSDVLDYYALARPIKPNSRYQMGRTIGVFAEFLDHPAACSDLLPEVVSAWIRWLEPTYSQVSVSGHRGKLLCVWRFAHRRGWAAPVDDVRRAPRPEPMPEAWELGDVQKLLSACDVVRRAVRGVWLPDYFRALILAAYESGLRRSDLWRLARDTIHQDGSIVVRQHKTGSPHVARIQPSTAAAVLALPGAFPLAWPGVSPREFYAHWGDVLLVAGVAPGALQKLRRTGATYIAKEHGTEAAASFLGHRSAGMHRFYIDRRIADPPPRMPPRLTG